MTFEKPKSKIARCNFNKPFGNIKTMERITNSAFSKFEGRVISNTKAITGGADKFLMGYKDGNQHVCIWQRPNGSIYYTDAMGGTLECQNGKWVLHEN